jgi:hypothetical protein
VQVCGKDHETSPVSVRSTVTPTELDKTGECSSRLRTSNLGLQYDSIKNTLDWMIRYAMLIRRAASQHRDTRAESHEDPRDQGYHGIRAESGDLITSFRIRHMLSSRREINSAEAGQERESQEHEKPRPVNDMACLDGLADLAEYGRDGVAGKIRERLIEANVKRRQRFLYLIAHDRSLQARLDINDTDPKKQRVQRQSNQPARLEDTRSGVQILSSEHEVTQVSPSTISRNTEASKVDPRLLGFPNLASESVLHAARLPPLSSFTSSTAAPGIRMDYPKLPNAAKSSDVFQCSFCRQTIGYSGSTSDESHKVSKRKSWWR